MGKDLGRLTGGATLNESADEGCHSGPPIISGKQIIGSVISAMAPVERFVGRADEIGACRFGDV